MRIYQDGTCRYNGQAYATLHEALAALWQQNKGGTDEICELVRYAYPEGA